MLASSSASTDTLPMAQTPPIRLRVSRSISVPDRMKISRYAKVPELGPRLLFFSGGSALHGLSRQLKAYTHNSVHLITPFDSGGSSAALRQAFDMPAIGDLRHRLMALADESVLGNPEVYQLFGHRLSRNEPGKRLRRQLAQMIAGDHELTADIPPPMRQLICTQLDSVCSRLPAKFDLRGASIGNFILAGGYISNDNNLDATLFLFSKLVNVQGTVRAIVNDNAHLGATLQNGRTLIGQHLLTGKEHPPIDAPIASLFLSSSQHRQDDIAVKLRRKNAELIGNADLICFAQGSFYSSLIANLLPRGVGRAVARNGCPKVYIPNLGSDPEQLGMSFENTITTLLEQLRSGTRGVDTADILNYVLVDTRRGRYPFPVSVGLLKELGIELLDLPLVTKKSAPYYDDTRVLQALLSLV